LWRLQSRHPLVRQLLRKAGRVLNVDEGVIRRGVGAGLKF
jgi:hypothetical protein